jgi:alcohol dehydrogenase YqhD (iron-dependent ADH family)
LANGNDLEARAQVQWSSIVALNGWVQVGVGAGYPVHMIEHVLSAHHDITHAAGLAVVNPAWMRFAAESRPSKFVQFAERIFGLQAKQAEEMDCALEGIHRFEEFLRSIGCPARLSELGIDDKLITRYAEDTVRIIHDGKGFLPGRPPMSEADIEAVLRSAL